MSRSARQIAVPISLHLMLIMLGVPGCEERAGRQGAGANTVPATASPRAPAVSDEPLPVTPSPERCVREFVAMLRSGEPGRAVGLYCETGTMAMRTFGSSYAELSAEARSETCELFASIMSAPYEGEGLAEYAGAAVCTDFVTHDLPGDVFEVRYKITYPGGSVFESSAQVQRNDAGRLVVIDVAAAGGVPLTHLVSRTWLGTGMSPVVFMRGFASSMLQEVERVRATMVK